MIVGYLRHVLSFSVCDLQEEHGVVVDNVEKEDDVDDEGEQVLRGGSWVALVDLVLVYFCADEDELNDDDGDKIDDSSGVVVEEEEFGLIEGLSRLY